jgi:outer membrane protein assembly factor BamB
LLFLCKANAQTPSVKWWYNTNDASFGQSAAGDIDGDGKLEIVFGCYRNDSSVYALNAEDGSLLWKYNTHSIGAEGCNDVAPIIYDVDNDSHLEVVLPSSCNPKTFCFNGLTGAVKWQCNTEGSDSPPTIADVDNDGKPEILHGEFGGTVRCLNAENGSLNWVLNVDLNSWIQTAPTIVDLDNNGQLDFVVGTWNFDDLDSIYAYRGDNHTLLWTYPVHDVMYHGTAVADLDKDGKPELVIGSYNDTLYCINGENGTTKWKYAASGGYIGAPASIGDIDSDGYCEVVFVSGYKVCALSNTGTLQWQYNIPGYSGAFRGCALADINNDAFPDVIFGTDNGKVIALMGNNGTLIWSIDLAAHYGNSDFGIDHAPLISDFDNNDTLDVFIVGGYSEYPAFQNNFGRAYMLTAGKGNGPDWLMFQRDIRRQSSLCKDTTNAVIENPEQKNEIKVFPNPTHNKIEVTGLDNGTIEIINLQGQIVKTLNTSGTKTTIDLSKLPSGLYLVKILSYEGVVTKKLIKE